MFAPKKIKLNQSFIGRALEKAQIEKIGKKKEASILVVYGRRRVGKTELLEQTLRLRNLLKFEGIEGLTADAQRKHVLEELAEYCQEPLMAKLKIDSWKEIFKLIAQKTEKGQWTLYFEEVQWLAEYSEDFISELKYVWDNYFRYNKDLLLVLCGSSPSFMINQVIHSKALYNRSQYEIHLEEFNPIEVKQFMPKRANRELMDAILTVGGFPEYLKRLNENSSVFLSLCDASFKKNSFFSREYERIFTSSMSGLANYQEVLEYLSQTKFATRADILKHLKIKSGGKLSTLLKDLELCGFIEKYAPYNLQEAQRKVRYAIKDAYLQYYYKFIKPQQSKIEKGQFDRLPTKGMKTEILDKYLGFSFERFCRRYHYVIAKILGFSAVQYRSGAFYSRKAEDAQSGYQIDLVFERDDKVITICEIKYLKAKVGTSVVQEMENKLSHFPATQEKTIHKVLITTVGAEQALIRQAYFDDIITLDAFFDANNW